MIDRRRLLLSGAAAGAALAAQPALARVMGLMVSPSARMAGLFNHIFDEQLTASPELATTLGLDKGAHADAKARLDDRSAEAVHRYQGRFAGWAKDLRELPHASLTGMNAANYDTVLYVADLVAKGAPKFPYGVLSWPSQAFTAPSPYVVSQLTGAYQSVPDFLDSQHTIETKSDAEAYLSRLNAFAVAIDQETERTKADCAAGAVHPDFIMDVTLGQLRDLGKSLGPTTPLVTSVARRAADKHIDGDWAARAATIVEGPVAQAVERQIKAFETLRPSANHDAGVWKIPGGEAYYATTLKANITTDQGPDEVHKIGLDLTDQITARLDVLFKAQGMSQGAPGERLSALAKDPRFLYPNTEAGKADLIAYLNGLVATVTAKLPQYFGALPKAGLQIKRVPQAIEAGAPGGYYNGGSLDGSRAGAYYINLRDTGEWPKWTLPTLTYHEGVPGHHLQITLANEAQGLPMLRKAMGFNAYQEGWALYSEQLADEIGLYDADPWGRIGYLHDALLRACRLVVDTGLHAKRWTREQSITFMTDKLGLPESPNVTEVERYCVWPGQACSYMIGKLTWLRLRAAAKAAMGDKFDIRGFHDAGLLAGPMPLEVLQRRIEGWSKG
jgi:uncharacterized protein (DUF885 family)